MKYILALSISFCTCSNDKNNNTEQLTINDSLIATSALFKTAIEAEPLLSSTDSLQILFYDDPEGDSLRYSRFYTYHNTNDGGIIKQLISEMRQPAEYVNEVRRCRSQGKIYLYSRSEPVKTVYFSTNCNACCYLYFIEDGSFIYMPLSNAFKQVLFAAKTKATKPVSGN